MKFLPKNTACKKCDSTCCKYITIELETPQKIDDFENIRWYLAHRNIKIIVEEDGSWWIKFITDCEKLDKNNLCKIYKNRPKPCKEFSIKQCPLYTENNSLIEFETIKEIDDYIKNVFKKGKHYLN